MSLLNNAHDSSAMHSGFPTHGCGPHLAPVIVDDQASAGEFFAANAKWLAPLCNAAMDRDVFYQSGACAAWEMTSENRLGSGPEGYFAHKVRKHEGNVAWATECILGHAAGWDYYDQRANQSEFDAWFAGQDDAALARLLGPEKCVRLFRASKKAR